MIASRVVAALILLSCLEGKKTDVNFNLAPTQFCQFVICVSRCFLLPLRGPALRLPDDRGRPGTAGLRQDQPLPQPNRHHFPAPEPKAGSKPRHQNGGEINQIMMMFPPPICLGKDYKLNCLQHFFFRTPPTPLTGSTPT